MKEQTEVEKRLSRVLGLSGSQVFSASKIFPLVGAETIFIFLQMRCERTAATATLETHLLFGIKAVLFQVSSAPLGLSITLASSVIITLTASCVHPLTRLTTCILPSVVIFSEFPHLLLDHRTT